MTRVKDLMEQGGDWDRRNRLKAYEALYLMSTRDFKGAATLFLEAVPTFGSLELMSFEQLVFYTVITSMLGKRCTWHAVEHSTFSRVIPTFSA